jgi:hypothetical protein
MYNVHKQNLCHSISSNYDPLCTEISICLNLACTHINIYTLEPGNLVMAVLPEFLYANRSIRQKYIINSICLFENLRGYGEKKNIFQDSVTTSGQIVLPVKTRHIILYAHRLTLRDTKKKNDLRYCRKTRFELSPSSCQTIKLISKWLPFFS